MEKITNKKILNIITLCVLLIVPFLKFFSMNLEAFGIISDYDFINPAIVLYISAPILLFIYIKQIKDTKRKLDIFDYLFYILVIVGLISTMLAINKNLSIFGKDYRHEGLLSILSYYLLFINWKLLGSKEDIKKYIKLFIIIGIVNSIYAIFQIYLPFTFVIKYGNDVQMASGLCGNPNFLGSLIVTVISIVTCSLLINNESILKNTITIILLFITLINCQSTGPFLAYILLILLLIGFLYKKKCLVLKNVLILFIVLISVYISIFFINKNLYEASGNKYKCEMCISSVKETINNGGTGRLDIWKNSLGIVKGNFIFGVGFDNFYLAYPNPKIDNLISFSITNGVIEKSPFKSYYIVDNAHNVYLHTLVSNGLLGLIPYLLLCLLTFIKGLKSNNKLIFILLSGFVAYSIQAFANISVIQVAPIYFVIIGLILSENRRTNKSLT